MLAQEAAEDESTRMLRARCEELEAALAIQKREHERTTSKLTLLLKKRGLDSDFDQSERALQSLRQEVALLKWQKSQAESRANRLEVAVRFGTTSSCLPASVAAGDCVAGRPATQRTASIPSRQVTPENADQAQRIRTQTMCDAKPNVPEAPQAKRKLDVGSVTVNPASSFGRTASQPSAFGYQAGAICVQQPKRQRVPIAAAPRIVVVGA